MFPAAFMALKAWRLDMNVLMMVAVLGAWLIGEGAEAASVVFLFALAELLESWSVGRARNAISSLLKLTPETALVRSATQQQTEVPVSEVPVGATISVLSGARIPLDGQVVEGHSTVNQAPITGESVPVDKQPGDAVYAGTINGQGSLLVSVTKTADNSTLSRMVQLVESAEENKAPTQRFVDRFARVYTPAVFVVALLLALIPTLLLGHPWMDWIYRALALLVIACPCALVIATPVTIISGLTALARRGVLVKGGAYLEETGRMQALAVDKTGTVTQGKPQVTGVYPITAKSENEVLTHAAAIDAHSDHPLARAVCQEAQNRRLAPLSSSEYQAIVGKGATAEIAGKLHFVGNHQMAHDMKACDAEVEKALQKIEERGESVAIVGTVADSQAPGTVLGLISLGDPIRAEIHEALTQLRKAGVSPVVMLSGDNQRTVTAIAQSAGITEAHGSLLPEQKIEHLRRLLQKHKYVGMIGDGVNDAPALALASVGIAMGAIGSDTAIETADVALMRDDLNGVAQAVVMGRRTLNIIRFNVFFALAVKAVFLVLAFTGYTSLWLAILADTGATLLVIANALRLLRNQRP